MGAVEFWVPGVPQPQGSKTAFVVNGRAVIVDKNPKLLKPWRTAVTAAAREAWQGREQLAGAVSVCLQFRIERPASVRREFPSVRPDLDKYVRAVFDGITDAGCWVDDGQVVEVQASKDYEDRAGVLVRVVSLDEGMRA